MSFFDYVVADFETDGFNANVIWMGGAQNLLSGEYRSFIGADEIAELTYELAVNSKMVVGHFFRGFDRKIVKKLTGLDIASEKIIDTVEMSKHLCPELPNHKLETWGELFEYPKGKQPLFERFTPEMVPYCERDVRLNTKVFEFLLELFWEKHLENVPPKYELLLEFAAQKYT